MPTNYSGRFTVIVLFILIALAAIFWPVVTSPRTALDPSVPFSKKIGLRPGIDMVGGTSLLYEIRPPEGTMATEDLAQQMMASLKKRVDPHGTRNLIWRPQGATRLEIQMPLSSGSKEAEAKRNALIEARDRLESLYVRPGAVIAAVEERAGRSRAELDSLAAGSAARQALFDELVEAYDAIQAANQARNAEAEAEARIRYDRLKARIPTTNVSISELEAALAAKNRKERVQQLLERATVPAAVLDAGPETAPATTAPAGSFPQLEEAVAKYAAAYDEFQKVRNLIDDAADLKRLLRGSGVLEFHILAVTPEMARATGDQPNLLDQAEYDRMVERLLREGPAVKAGDRLKWFPVDEPENFGRPTVTYNDQEYVLAWITDEKSLDNRAGKRKWGLERAERSQTDLGVPVVAFTFDPQGAIYFGELTGNNLRQPLAIMLDQRVISAPNIREQITTRGQIDGGRDGFSAAELNYLVRTLNAGSLPAQLAEDPISERTIGPQLGADNLRAGFIACIFGLVVVAFFLIGYYYLAGVVAMIAVLLNMLFILGALAALPGATITLPGVAGIVLTIGMAVDANVLIFERLREEQVRGLSLRMALRNAYDRAWSAILDGNVTTGITALILYMFGSEEVKGFGLTLMIGIFSSLFTALFVTRTIFGVLIDRFGVENLGSLPLTFPKWDRALRPNIDWMSKAWIFYTFSGVFISVGLLAFGVKLAQGEMLDIEFTKGTSVQFELHKPTPQEEVRALVNAQSEKNPEALPAPSVVAVGTDRTTYEVVSPQENSSAVREAVVAALGERLKLDLPSDFEGSNLDLNAAMEAGVIVPIERADQTLPGLDFNPANLPSHVGGAAIILKNLDPPLTAKELERRIQRQRLTAQTAATEQSAGQAFDVEVDSESNTAVILLSDPTFPYNPADELKLQQWKDALIAPMWQLTTEAVTKPAGLQRVNNFDAQVAGETKRDAMVAMVLSIIVIMAYIWVRFGNLKYGTATVIALMHDTLFTLAAVGLAHYIAGTFIGNALLIEPFRVNLTLVAAVLTVMGYSMNDTVVVFDRIRENRGKFGVVSRQTVNDSINQTLSRTLLTGGTTMLTIFVMYVWGGSGIHGFTYALLVGIVVGTYSSIAIAAPILLFGAAREQESPTRAKPAGQLQRAGV